MHLARNGSTRRLWLVISLAALPAFAGCSCNESSAPAAEAPDEPVLDASPPAAMTIEMWFAGGRDALTAMRDQLRSEVVREFVPPNMGALVAQLAPVPEHLVPRVRDDAPVVGVRIDESSVLAFRVRREDGNSPLGPRVTLLSGGPFGSRYIQRGGEGNAPFIALYEDIVIVAKTDEDLSAGIGYLVARVRSEDLGEPGLHVRSAEGYIARRARTQLEASLDEQVASALGAVRAERARHDEAPALGDPEQLVRSMDRGSRDVTALLPDVESLHVIVGPTQSGLGVTAEIGVRADTPAARALAARTELPSAALGALPEGTVLGSLFASAAEGEGWLDLLATIAGERISRDDRATLERVSAAMDQHGGGAILAGIGSDPDGGFALLATPLGAGPDAETYDALLQIDYIRALLGEWFSCRLARTLAVGDPSDPKEVCTRGPERRPALIHARDDARGVLALAHSAEGAHPGITTTFEALASTAGSSPASGTLAANPDVARALAEAPERVLGAWVLVPGHLGKALALSESEALQGLGGALVLDARPAPSLLFVERVESGARVRLILLPGAVDQAVNATMRAVQIF